MGKKATIEEVSTSGECHEFCAKVGPEGLVGDQTDTPGILVLNAEVPHHLNTEFGEMVLAGQLGDNILIKDFSGNITDLPKGTLIVIQQKVVLRVKAKAAHYTKKRFPRFTREAFAYLREWGGVTCEVVEGVGSLVCDGQEIEIRPEEKMSKSAA